MVLVLTKTSANKSLLFRHREDLGGRITEGRLISCLMMISLGLALYKGQ